MAIGYQVTQASINGRAGALAVRLEQLAAATTLFSNLVIGTLGTAGLQALGYGTADAANMSNAASFLSGLAGLYYGLTVLPPAGGYDASLANVRGLGGAG